MYRGTAGQCRIHVHHACIKAITCIGGHLVSWFKPIVTLVPVAESHQVAVSQLASLGHSCRARSVEHDEQLVRVDAHFRGLCHWQSSNLIGQEQFAIILVDNRAQILFGNKQLCAGILHHEVEPFLGIAGIQRLVTTSSLEHTERRNRHPLAARNQHRHHVFGSESLACDKGGDAVTDFTHLGISKLLVLKNDSNCLRGFPDLPVEKRHNVLGVIVVHIVMVERVQSLNLGTSCNTDFTQVFVGKKSL